jgi:signal transduction histidine kinase
MEHSESRPRQQPVEEPTGTSTGPSPDYHVIERRLDDALWKLQAQEERFRGIVERSGDGIIVLDSNGLVLFANSAAEKLFGRDRQELIGSDFGYPAVAGENTEIDILRGAAEPRTAEMRVVDTTWEATGGLLVIIRDITDQKAAHERERALIREHVARIEAEAQMRRAELLDRATRAMGTTLDLDELLRRLAGVIVEELADVCLIDIDDQNGPMRRLAAARREYPHRALLKGLEERPVQLGLHSAEARVLHTGASELLSDLTPEQLERAASEDESIAVYSVLRPCSLMMVTLYAGSLRWGVATILSCDTSVRFGLADLALAEELVRRAGMTLENARLFRLAQQASKAKSDFLAIVSHELRTPLSAIIGYTGLMEEGIGGSLTGRQAEYLRSVRRSADHLVRLIDQIITFARLEGDHERVRIRLVDVGRLLGDLGVLTRPLAARKGLELLIDLPSSQLVIESDEQKLAQILINLVTNAIKFTERGTVHVQSQASADELVFMVQDTGPGIPADKLSVIFEPFRQLEEPRTRREGGTGIGLSLVRNLTHLLGGEVGVSSRLGSGSTFTVRLPRRGPPVPSKED